MGINSVEDFLSHSSRAGGNFMTWKKDGKVEVWLHTKRLPIALWRHQFPKVTIKEDDDGEAKREVFMGSMNCQEDEAVLKQQYFTDDDGIRQAPPVRCPICLFTEWVRMQVVEGQLSWTKPVFKLDHERDPSRSIVLHAGGIYGAFGERDMDDDKKKELAAAGISLKVAWREKVLAGLNYVFCVVDNAHPDKGILVSTEAGLLGDKVKDVIADTRVSLGDDEGNPYLNPYCFQWIYFKDEQPNKKYKARPLLKVKMTPAIEALILKTPAPDVSKVIEPFNSDTLRAFMERNCLLKGVPWDDIFKNALKVGDKSNKEEQPKEEKAEAGGRRRKKKEEPKPAPEAKTIPCDECKKPMLETATKCDNCGAEYEVTADEPAPPSPPAQTKKRSEAKAEKARAKVEQEAVDEELADDQIPF
jgi:hypothetical protein